MRVIRAEDCRRMPWKNGGGETIEIAISPDGASVDSFDWRVSSARVDRDGAFSLFADVDRTLAVLEGEGVVLSIAGRQPVRLTTASEPCSFPGDVATEARLVSGPIVDLNLMTRRDLLTHSVSRIDLSEVASVPVVGHDTLVYCASGSATLDLAGLPAGLVEGDTAQLGPAAGKTLLRLEGNATLFVIELFTE